MADLSEVRIGSKLLLSAEVVGMREEIIGVRIEGDHPGAKSWFRRRVIEAAEHIPAPRVFKRGDWVSWRAHGAVQMVVADADDELVWVTSDDPANNILWRKQDCEPTEAPE